MRWRTQLALVALGLCTGRCAPASEFVCTSDAQCVSGQTPGMCQPTGFCSFADPDCGSGQRYADHAAADLAHTCVLADGASGEQDTGAAASSTSGATFATTTAAVDDGGPTTSPTASTSGPADGGATNGSTDGSTDSATDGSTDGSTDSATDSATGGPAVACAPFHDDFDDGVVDPAWNQAYPRLVTEAGDALSIEISAMDATDAAGIQMFDLDLTDAQATIELGVLPQSVYAQIVFGVFGANQGDFVIVVVSPSTLAVRRGDATGTDQLATVPFEAVAHRRLRLSIDTAGVSVQTSATGAMWDELVVVAVEFDFYGGRAEVLATNWQPLDAPETVSIRQFDLCCSGVCPP